MKDRLRETATDAILDAAEEVAVERGLDATSCAAIAERAGVAVGTLYNYFPDRDGILQALLKTRRAQIAPEIVAAAAAAAHFPFEQRLRVFVTGFSAAFDKRRPFVRLAMQLDRYNKHTSEPTLLTLFERSLTDIFAAAETTGEIPKGRSAAYAAMFAGALRSLKHISLDRDEPMDHEMMIDVFLHGATAR